MNRKERRQWEKVYRHNGYTDEQAKARAKAFSLELEKKRLHEADIVRINVMRIASAFASHKVSEKFRQFAMDNANKEFTVEYDPHHLIDPCEVCLKEDPSDPKWLFWEGYLEVVKRIKEDEEEEGHADDDQPA